MYFLIHLFSFEGRLSRGQFLFQQLIIISFSILVYTSLNSLGTNSQLESNSISTIYLVFYSIFLFAFLSCCTRRFHDLGYAEKMLWSLVIPLANIYWILNLMFLKGKEGRNKFGENPHDLISSGNSFNLKFLSFIFLFLISIDTLFIYLFRN